MNSYELSRAWFDYSFNHPDKIRPIHTSIYFFAIEHCNRLGWKTKFGFPTSMVLEATGIKSYSSYKKHFDEIVEFGFFKVHEYSKNQYSSNVIELSLNVKANNKALDKALSKHSTKHCSSIYQSTVSIDKQVTIKQGTIEQRKLAFADSLKPFVEKYGREFMNDFYYYWTESTLDKKKLKFEMQKTFSVEHRLRTWKKTSTKFGTEYRVDNKPQFNPYG
ncbi:hypothetical protein UFOVP211_30 [uncultured Caudovirales phage]|uniref:Uncharacterized protein n=1 Tax=uncultured Caudovirales phage TaxID=2100421 RepID=A0A6J7WP71_9CAUD|nr:hypothetical protein UFOVP211_30 [uncultured Caudovirales phage]